MTSESPEPTAQRSPDPTTKNAAFESEPEIADSPNGHRGPLGHPEPWLCALNLAAVVALFHFDWVEVLYGFFKDGLLLAGLPLSSLVRDMVFGCLLAPFLLPVALFVVLPVVALGLGKSESFAIVWTALLVNAAIWGDTVMFLRRLIRTGSVRFAWGQVFRWLR